MPDMPPGVGAAIAHAVAEYEPQATATVIASPKQLLSVLLEAAQRATAAAVPLLAAAHEETITSLLATIAQAEGIIANRDREIEQLRNQLMALEVNP